MTDKVREKEELRLEVMRKEERVVLDFSPIAGVEEAPWQDRWLRPVP